MANISKKARVEIASIFNSIVVSNIFIDKALKEKDNEAFDHWWSNQRVDTVRLYEEYGIELPTLKRFLKDESWAA